MLIKDKMKKGFSLLEMILSLALVGLVLAISLPLSQSYQNQNNFREVKDQLVSMIRKAQLFSQGSIEDSGWGVYISSTAATLFKGSSFALRDFSYDEVYDLPMTVGLSGTQQFVFNKISGELSSSSSLTLISLTNETSTININQKGIVE